MDAISDCAHEDVFRFVAVSLLSVKDRNSRLYGDRSCRNMDVIHFCLMIHDIETPEANVSSPSERNPVSQYGALCLRRDSSGHPEILLITTRETKRWTVPKGWPIKGLRPHRVAEREAWEEAGVRGRAKKRPIGRFNYLKRLADGVEVPASVDVHLLQVRRIEKKFPERRERKLAWVRPAEAVRMVAEGGLQAIFRSLDTQFQS